MRAKPAQLPSQAEPVAKNSPSRRIPVTVLGGYLGAGKTTIINRLLSQSGGTDPVRIAVLVNDFGTINLDAALISSRSDSVIELSNGCICCSLADGFAATLDQINQRALANPSAAPQQLVIETSGVALPGAVAQYAHMPGFELVSIIVLADSEQLSKQLTDRYVGETVRAQLGAADLILLSKTDLITAAETEAANVLIRSASQATVIPTSQPTDQHVDLMVLFFGEGTARPPAPTVTSRPLPPDTPEVNLAVDLAEVSLAQPVERQQLERWLQTAPAAVARVKGVIQSDEGLLRVDRVGSRVRVQTQHDQIATESTGTLIILSIGSAHFSASSGVARWLRESPRTT